MFQEQLSSLAHISIWKPDSMFINDVKIKSILLNLSWWQQENPVYINIVHTYEHSKIPKQI